MRLLPPMLLATATGWREPKLLAETAGLQANDFIDKQTKLFTAQYAVPLTLKMLNKITGGLQNAVLNWNLKLRFNFPISLASQISILSAISGRISQRIHWCLFQRSLGFVLCTEQSFRRSLWH